MPRVNGKRIRQLRQALGWSVKDLAERTKSLAPPGITRSALGRIEREETTNPAAWRLECIANALDVPITELIVGAKPITERDARELSLEDALRASTTLGESDIRMVCEFVRFLEGRKL